MATGEAENRVDAPPPGAVTSSLSADAAPEPELGEPTSLEGKISEEVEKALEKLKAVLDDLDIAITIKNTPNGKEIRFRNMKEAGTATSEEESLPYKVMPGVQVDVGQQSRKVSDQNAVRLATHVGGEAVTLAAVGVPGEPTAADGGSSSVVTQAYIEQEQKGLINTNLSINAVVNIGGLFVVQVNG